MRRATTAQSGSEKNNTHYAETHDDGKKHGKKKRAKVKGKSNPALFRSSRECERVGTAAVKNAVFLHVDIHWYIIFRNDGVRFYRPVRF